MGVVSKRLTCPTTGTHPALTVTTVHRSISRPINFLCIAVPDRLTFAFPFHSSPNLSQDPPPPFSSHQYLRCRWPVLGDIWSVNGVLEVRDRNRQRASLPPEDKLQLAAETSLSFFPRTVFRTATIHHRACVHKRIQLQLTFCPSHDPTYHLAPVPFGPFGPPHVRS